MLGRVVRGSLSEGLTLRLEETVSVESLRAGKFVVVEGESQRFFSLVTDVSLAASDMNLLSEPPGYSAADLLMAQLLQGTALYGEAKIRPMLMLEKIDSAKIDSAKGSTQGALDIDDLRPVKTIPAHFRPVFDASEQDVAAIFGSEDPAIAGSIERAERYFHLGQPLDMETPVCLNLDRFIERSSGIFGKSGTGKTFLTRICLCGVIQSQKAVALIFDMHSEYGWRGTIEGKAGGSSEVRGLKQYFGSSVQIFTIDEAGARRRGVLFDFAVKIPYTQIEPEDILLLGGELNLPPTATETAYLLESVYKETWLAEFLKMDGKDLDAFAKEHNGNTASLSALQRRLKRLTRYTFLVPTLPEADDAVKAILRRLEQGTSVVLEFGQEGQLAYMLVANILTRRIHDDYVKKKEAAQGDKSKEPRPLVIAIEEAHKFLDPHVVDQTIFGTIARELRKYNVTLLIVDQRPSGIADEVLSQIGTRITCLLNDEKDIDAVLTGVSGARELRGVLAALDSKQQALVFGHAVPMPVVIKTRTYDDEAFRLAMAKSSQQQQLETTLAIPEQARRQKSLDFD
jgi:uncharacterized protein